MSYIYYTKEKGYDCDGNEILCDDVLFGTTEENKHEWYICLDESSYQGNQYFAIRDLSAHNVCMCDIGYFPSEGIAKSNVRRIGHVLKCKDMLPVEVYESFFREFPGAWCGTPLEEIKDIPTTSFKKNLPTKEQSEQRWKDLLQTLAKHAEEEGLI